MFGLKFHYTLPYKNFHSAKVAHLIFTTKHLSSLSDIDYNGYSSNLPSLRTNSSVTFNIFSEKGIFSYPFIPIIFTKHLTFRYIRHYNLSFCFHAVISPSKIRCGKYSSLTTPQNTPQSITKHCLLEYLFCFISQLQRSNSNGRLPNINRH